MNTKWIDECVLEALTSGMNERQLKQCMKGMDAHSAEIDQAVRELRAARSFDETKFREVVA